VQKLLSVTGHIDVGLSHDWPAWIELFGDSEDLYAKNPHFYESAKKDGLGSKPANQLFDHLRPSYWFSGHMHVRFEATVQNTGISVDETARMLHSSQTLESDLPVFDDAYKTSLTQGTPGIGKSKNATTSFLALGKVGQDPGTYLELLELVSSKRPGDTQYLERTADGHYRLHYDEEWLAITQAYNDTLFVADPETLILPSRRRNTPRVSAETIAHHQLWVHNNVSAKRLLCIPLNFATHAPLYSTNKTGTQEQPNEFPNLQTSEFAKLLQMQNKFEGTEGGYESSDHGSDGIEFG
jgi:lariat debranching enzyme